jgi:cytochrome c553
MCPDQQNIPMHSIHRRLPAFLLQAALTLAMVAVARATPSRADGPRLSRPCVVCHQLNTWGSPDGVIPNLAGQQVRYLERQLAVFRSGSRVDTGMEVMTAHQTLHNQKDVVTLSHYLAGLSPNPDPVMGSGEHLRVGKEQYAHICAACHGIAGLGDPGNRVPRIAGQHYPYLRRQIEAASDLHKDLAPPEMTSALRGTPPAERDALADYISRLGTSKALLDSNRLDESGK